MKKFSNITNQKVGEAPKLKDKLVTEEDLFKYSVLNLMEQLLVIRTYGPVDRYLRAGSIKIAGKEMFLEALIDLMSVKSLKDKAVLLESLKSKISDWESLDKGIDDLNSQINESRSGGKMLSHRNRITSLLKSFKDDKEELIKQFKEMADKIRNGDKAHWRGITAEQMSSEGISPTLMKQVAEIFNHRSKQLGYKK